MTRAAAFFDPPDVDLPVLRVPKLGGNGDYEEDDQDDEVGHKGCHGDEGGQGDHAGPEARGRGTQGSVRRHQVGKELRQEFG